MKKLFVFALSCIAISGLLAGTAFGLNLNLVAEEATVTMPDATVVTMWGLRDTADATHAAGEWKIPVFSTVETDSLTITLTNNLPADTVALPKPTSLIIPGLQPTEAGAMVPTWTDGSTGSRFADPANPTPAELALRVRSLTHEAANGAGSATYEWATLKPGTYLIQSGTHQAVQVPMGLYAVLIVTSSTPGLAYNPSATVTAGQLGYTADQALVFSEIDSGLHAAVAADDYGPGQTYTSTMEFHPDYFLINGQPYSAGAPPISIGSVDDDVLLRLVNAGNETRVPVFQGEYVSLIAEDGNLLPYVHEQYSVQLAPGKTKDVILSQPRQALIPVYDGTLALNSGGVSGGGMLTHLAVSSNAVTVLSPNGGETLTAGLPYTVQWLPDPGASSYQVAYSLDSGASWNFVSYVTETSATWTVPNVTSSTAMVRIGARDAADNWIAIDVSDGVFSIAPPPALAVVSPNGGESLDAYTRQTIAWSGYYLADSYNIYYSTDNFASAYVIASGVKGTSYNWLVPNQDSVNAIIRVAALDAASNWLAFDDSDGPFTIVPEPAFTVDAPNGGESLPAYSMQTISWNGMYEAHHYNIYYSTDNFASASVVASGVMGTSYSWTVPNLDTANAVIRVAALDAANNWLALDDSDGPFAIVPFAVTNPLAGAAFSGGDPVTVSWNAHPQASSYQAAYSLDNGVSWNLISYETGTTAAWTVPNANTTQAQIRIGARDAMNNWIAVAFSGIFDITTP